MWTQRGVKGSLDSGVEEGVEEGLVERLVTSRVRTVFYLRVFLTDNFTLHRQNFNLIFGNEG